MMQTARFIAAAGDLGGALLLGFGIGNRKSVLTTFSCCRWLIPCLGSYNGVFPSQFAHLLIQYQRHPEAKSLAPDGTPCSADTKGLLRRVHVIAGEIRYVGKVTDSKWEDGDAI